MRHLLLALLFISGFCGVAQAAPVPVSIEQAWMRPASKGGEAAIYLVLKNTGNENMILRDIATPIADMAMVHETVVTGGVAHMNMLEDMQIKPGEEIAFSPRGKHVMLSGLHKALKLGDHFPLAFTFDKGDAAVDVLVQNGPASTN